MIVVRTILQAKPGKAGQLAQLMADSIRSAGPEMAARGRWRILTDLSGPFDTMVMETDYDSLAAWEQFRAELFASAAFQESFGQSAELITTGGRSEFFTLEAEGASASDC